MNVISDKEKRNLAAKRHYYRNREAKLAYQKQYIADNRERRLEYARKYRAANKVKRKEYQDQWRQNNPNYHTDYMREVWYKRPSSKMISQMRHSLSRCLSEPKYGRTHELIGYTNEELVSHIESLFKDGMTWGNYGDWEIDHIKPVSLFVKEGETDPSVINHLTNLQPLWKDENRTKGSKF